MPANRALALETYRRSAATYDRHLAARYADKRRRAVQLLRLRPADVILDAGCGTGLSFPLVEEAVGAQGRIIGIDQSAEMLAEAQKKIDVHGWQNITLVQSPLEDARIPSQADAVLFFLVHDILRAPRAMENLFHHVKPGGRAVAAGWKWAPWWALPANLRVWRIIRHSQTTLKGLGRPWSLLEPFLADPQVEEASFGAFYFARGRLGDR